MKNMKKAPVGSSKNISEGNKGARRPNLGKLHSAGKTVPSWNAARIDKMSEQSGSGGVKK